MRKMILAAVAGAAVLAGGFTAAANASSSPAPKAPVQQVGVTDQCGAVGETGVQGSSDITAGGHGKAPYEKKRPHGQTGDTCTGDGATGETGKTSGQGVGRTGR